MTEPQPTHYRILINNEKELSVPGGTSLLRALARKGILVPSACGGRGLCGFCKTKVISGAGDFQPAEERLLNEKDRAEGLRLACCVSVENDLEIALRQSVVAMREYQTRVERIRNLTYDVKEFRLALVEPSRIKFRAGQYAQIKIPPYEGSVEEVFRAYSIASSPKDEGSLEFTIRRVPSGIATTYLFDHIKEGDPLLISGPYGLFTLRNTSAEIIFIAGSTGIAPVCSMLHGMVEKSIDRKATFFFGAVEKRDLFYTELMREFEERLPSFHYKPALSNPTSEDLWKGEVGLVTEVLGRHLDDGSRVEAYLCGSPGMIDACVQVLGQKGVTEDRIFYDRFA